MFSQPENRWYSTFRNRKTSGWKLKTVIIFLTGVGLVDTGFLLYNHFFFQGQCQILPLGLNILGNDCGLVTSSPYGTFIGFPLSLWGSVGYSSLLLFTLMSLIKKSYFWITTGLSGFGALTSWGLTWIQYSLIEEFCPLCLISMVVMSILFFTALIGIIIYQPRPPSGKQMFITLILAGWLTTNWLLAYKITEDWITPTPPVSTSGVDDIPAGVITNRIVLLSEIDELLQKYIHPSSWGHLIENKEKYGEVKEELRRRGLYLLGLEFWADQEGIPIQVIVKTALEENPNWEDFISLYLPLEEMLQATDSGERVEEVQPQVYQEIMSYMSNRIVVQENIPPPHLHY